MTFQTTNGKVTIATKHADLFDVAEAARGHFEVFGFTNRTFVNFAMTAGRAGVKTLRRNRKDGTVKLVLCVWRRGGKS